MSIWRRVIRGIRSLLHPGAADREVSEEVELYLEQATEEQLAHGVAPGAARRAARLEMGNVTAVREQVRSVGWEHQLELVLADIGYAARQMRNAPGFTTLVVLTLALGIGATAAIFSVANPVLFRSLPYPRPEQIVKVQEFGAQGARQTGTFGMYQGIAQRARTVDMIAAFKPWPATLTDANEPEALTGQRVSAGYFHVLGVTPFLGHDFDPRDDVGSGPNVAIIGHALWQRRFAADPAIVGRQITLNSTRFTVIGVMPSTFENVMAPDAQVWALFQAQGYPWGHNLGTIARLRPGVALELATRDLNAAAQAVLVEQHPETYGPPGKAPAVQVAAVPLRDDLIRAARPVLFAVVGAVLLVLLVACVNVTNMFAARSAQRRGEFALRAALGAGRSRLIRQLLAESLLLSLVGGVLGIGLAVIGVHLLVALAPPGLPRLGDIAVDQGVLAFAVVLMTTVGLLVGLTPAIQASRGDPQRALQQLSRRSAGGSGRLRSVLVVAEVALAIVLLVGSGLLVRSVTRILSVPAGFKTAGLLTMQVQEAGQRYATDSAARARFFSQALDAVRRVPGVASAELTSLLPLSSDHDEYAATTLPSSGRDPVRADFYKYNVTPGYFGLMGIPLQRGRLLDSRDVSGAPPAAVISEALAAKLFPGADPIGQVVHAGGPEGVPPFTVVGVVGDVRQLSLVLGHAQALYTTPEQWYWIERVMSFAIRGGGNLVALTPAIQRAIWSADKDVPITHVTTMADLAASSAGERRFAMVLFTVFAIVALVLAVAGIYGVLSGSITERTREIGIRSALGASRTGIVTMVVRQGMRLTALGTVIGLAGAAVASRVIATMLYNVSPVDPVTYAAVAAVLAAVSAVACLVPARRAARVDPLTALRAE